MTNSTIEKKLEIKKKKKKKFYAKVSEIKRTIFLNHLVIVLLYKDAYLNTKKLNTSLPSSIVSLLQEFDDVFLEKVPYGLPHI